MEKYTLPSPKEFFKHQEMLKLAALQLEKDFGMFKLKVDVNFKNENYFEHIFKQIKEFVLTELHKNQSVLMPLLYQIDVSENKIKKHMQMQQGLEMHHVLAELIIEREIKKVITKLYFSEDPKKKALLLR